MEDDEDNSRRPNKHVIFIIIKTDRILSLLRTMPNNKQNSNKAPTCDLQLKRINEQQNVLANAIKGLDDDENDNVDIK